MDIDWNKEFSEHSDDVEKCWSKFKKHLYEGINRFIPKVKDDIWRKKANWICPITEDMKKIIRKKHRAWSRYIETRSVKFEEEFKKLRNQVRKYSREKEDSEQLKVAKECKRNPKKFWRYIEKKSKIKHSIGDIKLEDSFGNINVIQQDNEKAEYFNDYFSSIFTIEPTESFVELPKVYNETPMTPFKCTTEMIEKKLSNLKIDKSPGPDLLHPRILKEIKTQISAPLKHIFQTSLDEGMLPEDWRSSNITALFKKGDKSKLENYRPVSLTCIICKVLESLIRDHIMDYFIRNKLFSKYQFGFIKSRSTVLQMLKIIDTWTKYWEEEGYIDIIYTDFEKAFDRVPHRRLISKLHSYGIRSELVKWIENFLTARQQRTSISGNVSTWRSVLSGIPQGSVLGPLLFVIFINDLPAHVGENGEMFLFADDAKIFKQIREIEDHHMLQRKLNALQDWCDKWLITLNTSKCLVMRIMHGASKKDIFQYTIKKSGVEVELQEVERVKDLGIMVDNKLSFKHHIYEKVNKAYIILGIIKRNFKRIGKESFLLLYKSLVRSHLEYANIVWSPYNIGLKEVLEKVQKRATKIIPECKNLTYIQRLQYLKLPTLVYRRYRGDMIEVYKLITGNYDKEVALVLERNNLGVTRGHSLKLKTVRNKLEVRKNFFSNRIINIWNSLTEEIVTAENINIFKTRLDKFWQRQEIMYDWKAKIQLSSKDRNI